jgi:hypothetical protein
MAVRSGKIKSDRSIVERKIAMRKRRNRKPSPLNQNLDSFLDTLTNTVGVLMFVSLFMSLIAVQSGKARTVVTVLTPLVTETSKKPRFFEVRANQVTYIDDENVDGQIEDFLGKMSCKKPEKTKNTDDILLKSDYELQVQEYQLCLGDRAARLKNFRPKTSHYQVKLVDPKSYAWQYEPIKNAQGDSVASLAQKNSEFSKVLAKFNPQKDYLAFIVRPDSFEAFRQARQLAWQQGFNVGWEPQNPDDPIGFSSSGGRDIGIQ